jgi:hypothetical protein
VEKIALIPFTHVAQSNLENGDAWVVQSQHLVNATTK